jgi:hypothetical protein
MATIGLVHRIDKSFSKLIRLLCYAFQQTRRGLDHTSKNQVVPAKPDLMSSQSKQFHLSIIQSITEVTNNGEEICCHCRTLLNGSSTNSPHRTSCITWPLVSASIPHIGHSGSETIFLLNKLLLVGRISLLRRHKKRIIELGIFNFQRRDQTMLNDIHAEEHPNTLALLSTSKW